VRKFILTAVGALGLLGGVASANAPMSGSHAKQEFLSTPAQDRHRIRLNRGLVDTVGQQPNIARVCPQGARTVITKRNGWDVLLTAVTLGMYTPAHSYIACNPPMPG
jgi:hypothetical protein